ncbi:fusicoccadiene synthase [Seiridium cupressi]
MDFRHSEVIDKATYETHGLAGDIELRVHKQSILEIRGTLRVQDDWAKHVSPLPVDGYKGGLSHPYSFTSATIPECLPERLEILSYANEYAFLYDDEMENLDDEEFRRETSGILETFDNALDRKVSTRTRPEKRLQAHILAELMALDPTRATIMMRSWATFVQSASRTRIQPWNTLEEYVPARIIDAGELFWFGMLTFGMALTIPEEEYDLCTELAKPAYAVLGLTNDLYSWDKEQRDAERAGQPYVFNAVWVIMKERSVSEEEAISLCRAEIQNWMDVYRRIVDGTIANFSLSKDLRAYIEALLYSCVGNLVWSITCPRYRDL